MWLPIVIYVPALAFNQGKITVWVRVRFIPFEYNSDNCSYWSQRALNYPNRMHCLYFLHSRGRFPILNYVLVTPHSSPPISFRLQGGLKAVVWTDLIQTVLMFGAMILIIVKGTYDVGGVAIVWNRAVSSGRIEGPEYVLTYQNNCIFWIQI